MSDIRWVLAGPWGLVVLAAVADSCAAFVVKLRLNHVGPPETQSLAVALGYIWRFVQSPLVVAALVGYVAAPAIWFLALSRLELSAAYPVLVLLHLVFVSILSLAFLSEAVTLNKAIGILFAILSFYFLAVR